MLDARYSRISRKWVGFVTAIWVQSIAGNNYTFANYSPELKAVMHYNQLQLNNLGVAKDVGKSFGLLAGLLADRLPTWLILLIGAVEGAVGYGTQYLVIAQKITPPSYWQMCVLLCMGGNSSTWMNTAVLVTCMRNFPRSRGTVTGTLKGYIGLSTAIFTQLCTALFTSEATAFLLLLTFLPAIVCFFAIAFLTEVPPSGSHEEDVEEQKGFTTINWISLSLAVYLLTFTLLEFFFPFSSVQFKLFAAVLLLFLVAPLVVPFRLLLRVYDNNRKEGGSSPFLQSQRSSVTKPLLEDANTPDATQAILENVEGGAETEKAAAPEEPVKDVVSKRFPALGENHTLTEALMTVDFWLLFFTFLCGIGTGITAINNLGQIGEAQGFTDVSIFISLVSIWGFFGRIGAGAISEYYVKKAAVPRPVWMALSQVFLFFGYVLFATAAPGSLYLGSIVVGVCYGVHISITVPTASELFGLKHFGILYNFLILNIPLGSFLFSGVLAGWLYDQEASKTPHVVGTLEKMMRFASFSSGAEFQALGGDGDDPPKCMGPHCFRSVFIVMAGMCALGIMLNVVLILRIRPLYQDLYGPNGSIERKRRAQPRLR